MPAAPGARQRGIRPNGSGDSFRELCAHQTLSSTREPRFAKSLTPAAAIHTDRGVIRARCVINTTESHTASLFREFHGVLKAGQTQAAYGEIQGGTIRSGVAISSPGMFFCRLGGEGVLFGSDMSAVPDREAGRDQPSRFITRYVGAFLKSLFAIGRIDVANEWSGTVGMTLDEFPLIGLQDDRGLYIVAGLAGSGSGVSFLATRFVVFKILGLDGPDHYPEEFFSPRRFFKPH